MMNEITNVKQLLVKCIKCKEIIKSNDMGAIVNGAPYHYKCTALAWRKNHDKRA